MLGRIVRMLLGPRGAPSDSPNFARLWTLLYHLPAASAGARAGNDSDDDRNDDDARLGRSR